MIRRLAAPDEAAARPRIHPPPYSSCHARLPACLPPARRSNATARLGREQLELLLPTPQVMQPHPDPEQAHRLVAPGKCAGHQLPVAFQVMTGPGLLQRRLGKVMELDLDE